MVTMQLSDLLGGLNGVGHGDRIGHLTGGAASTSGGGCSGDGSGSSADPRALVVHEEDVPASVRRGPAAIRPPSRPPSPGPPPVPSSAPPPSPPPGGLAHLPHAGPVPLTLVRRLACDADLIPVVLGTTGRILDVGRDNRLVPAWMRRALTARDKGCAFPGCTIPASWCEGHHIVDWALGGSTGTDNAVLVCSGHHHLVHQAGWTVRLEGGRARFTPPWSALPRLTSNAFHSGSAV
ncbi:hypothetical protein C8046_17505 [Serinibacter arcticus]|uniref:HNH nuclease domain-containing protein n=2 Tax=Serinibacter arcticus TaxID=1655435 RepID=A0A2U2A098_9MICO|nr:hypothetical protein C8046_17505 [Serinibacter arcticus]